MLRIVFSTSFSQKKENKFTIQNLELFFFLMEFDVLIILTHTNTEEAQKSIHYTIDIHASYRYARKELDF